MNVLATRSHSTKLPRQRGSARAACRLRSAGTWIPLRWPYLRGTRMERTHRDLQGAEPGDGVSVAALAAKWGFTHLGRFAVDYRRRFGTYPSQTLRS